MKKSHRRKGVSVAMLEAAVEFVAERGGEMVEGYPVEPKTDRMPDAFAWTGLASTFLKAGFVEHHRGSETRPIMRRVAKFAAKTRAAKTRAVKRQSKRAGKRRIE